MSLNIERRSLHFDHMSYSNTSDCPGNGMSPMKWYDVLGAKAIRDFEEDELIEL